MSGIPVCLTFRKVFIASVFGLGMFLIPNGVQSAVDNSATLQWEANKEADLGGYTVYHGTSQGIYSDSQNAGKTVSFRYASLESNKTHYFTVTAYDTSGNESLPAPEVHTTIIAPDSVLSVSVTGDGTVRSSPAGLSCSSGTCSGTFTQGSNVTLTATPGIGMIFDGWNGSCQGTGGCVVPISASPASVSVAFAVSSEKSTEEQLWAVKTEYRKQRASLAQIKQQLESAEAEYLKQLWSINTEYRKQRASLTQTKQQQELAEAEYLKQLWSINTEYKRQRASLAQTKQQLESAEAEYGKQLELAKTEYRKQRALLAKAREQRELSEAEYLKQLWAVKTEYRKQRASLAQTKQQQELAKVEYGNQLEVVKAEYRKQRASLAKTKQQLELAKVEYENQLEVVKAKYRNQLATLAKA